jgi:hypothetical protein
MTSPKVKECKNKRILKGELKHEYQRRAGGTKEGENKGISGNWKVLK